MVQTIFYRDFVSALKGNACDGAAGRGAKSGSGHFDRWSGMGDVQGLRHI